MVSELVVHRLDAPGDVVVVQFTGEIDGTNLDQFHQPAMSAVREGHALVVVDLSGVGFADSRAMGAILAFHRIADAAGRRYCFVIPPTSAVMRLAQGLGITTLIRYAPDLEAALSGQHETGNVKIPPQAEAE